MTADAFTILNVDDNEIGRYAKTRSLQRAGYRVFEAATGREGLSIAEQGAPDLVLLDVKLPDMSGMEVCRLLKERHPGVMVLQISATFTDVGARIKGFDAGADAYVTQPVESDELLANIRALLRLREAESDLRELNATLETRVSEAVAAREKVEESLRQAQKMEALGQLTGGIAHDFNNLLMVVIGNLDIAKRALAKLDNGRADRAIVNAIKGGERAAILTQRLLAFARRQPLAPKPLDVGELVTSMANMLQRTLGERLELELRIEEGVWPVEADESQLENSILNLVVNARDAMPEGGRLDIHVANAEVHGQETEDFVRIVVRDTGVGMDKQTAERVFEPFFTTKTVGEGTGLGLSQVYGFVEQSGGYVELDSAPGKGTAISLFLPRSARVVAVEVAALRSPAPGRRDATILLVEDDDDVRAYTVEILRELNYRVLEAHDGVSALRLLRRQENKVALLITDVIMPGMNGRELTERARAIQPNLKVLYLTGYPRDVLAGEESRGAAVVSKPVRFEDFSRHVEMAIGEDA
ncbi:MAG: response regulator [Caulobacteraceae bacterium]